jgi:hypothetical protein
MEYCAYLVNSTPKYYYMLPLHFALVKRYASWLQMPLYLATEEPNHPMCQEVKAMGVTCFSAALSSAVSSPSSVLLEPFVESRTTPISSGVRGSCRRR